MSGIVNKSNLSKTIRYLKKNGIGNTYYAALERIKLKKKSAYTYVAPLEEELSKQRSWVAELCVNMPFITVVIPTYETPKVFLKEAIESVLKQTYTNWELIIADASASDLVQNTVEEYLNEEASKLRYIRLDENKGISDNTNEGIKYAKGDFVALLDHDDVYTIDALYEMAKAIVEYAAGNDGNYPEMLYSDEDKMELQPDGTNIYFDPHIKYDFNYDLLLSNNYICHLLIIRADLFSKIRLRSQFDGAQDYDLVLQVIRELALDRHLPIIELGDHIIHVKKVLYHWRSHANSTAQNTASKMYAYEAGLNALKEHILSMYSTDKITISHSKHLGFYSIEWGEDIEDIFALRPEIGAIAGRVLDKRGCMTKCIQDKDGNWLYDGINKHFAGELNRFESPQDVYYADPEYLYMRPELSDKFDVTMLNEKGYLIFYCPSLEIDA